MWRERGVSGEGTNFGREVRRVWVALVFGKVVEG
jgi:hypothetical protein